MKTDSIFYRIFQCYPQSFFELLGCPSVSSQYQFTSIEVKQLAFRLDGIFLPSPTDPDAPFYITEVQFQPDDDLYYRIFAELGLYLRQYQPSHPWRILILYASRSVERGQPHQFQEFLDCGRVTRLYLDELDASANSFGISIIKLVWNQLKRQWIRRGCYSNRLVRRCPQTLSSRILLN